MADAEPQEFPRKTDRLMRARMERAEGWDEAIGLAPELAFPPSWRVQIIPPFCGALMRFIVLKGHARVSVYADFNDTLGCYGEPYWEIYPWVDGEPARFELADTEAMMKAIKASLAKQNRRPPSPSQ